MLEVTSTKLANSTASTAAKHNDLFSTDIQKMTKFHIIYIMFELARKAISENKFKDPKVRENIEIGLKTFALNQLSQDCNALFETGYFGRGATELLYDSLKDVLIQLRPQMVPLAEMVDTTWNQLHSAIGNYHGDIYEQLLDFAKTSRLNKTSIPPYYEEFMKPLIQGNGDGGKFKL